MQSSKGCEKRSVAGCAICHIHQWPELAVSMPVMIPYFFSYYRLMEKSLERCNRVVCVSEYVEKYIKRHLNLKNLVTIYNFIDYEAEIRPQLTSLKDFDARNHLNLPSDAKIITYFGRLGAEKGVNILLEAFRIIRREFKEKIYLIIGGDGSERMSLENKAREIGNVVFTGFVSRRIQLGTISQSDIFVHPATYPDACPTAILEAMALGLPVIASRVGGNPELVVDGKGGYLFTPNSPKNLAYKISVTLDNELFRSKAGSFNRKWSHKFDIVESGMKIVKLYEEARANGA
jgi:glycosyltransferase involved in cell wall biosynthesis